MNKREAKFQTEFNRWLKYNWNETAVFELKVAETGALPYAAVAPHQLQNLQNAKNRKLIYKIPDDSLGQKPFDSFCIAKEGAYLVVKFERGTVAKGFYVIDVDDFANEIRYSDRKSLTETRASEIGKLYILGITL